MYAKIWKQLCNICKKNALSCKNYASISVFNMEKMQKICQICSVCKLWRQFAKYYGARRIFKLSSCSCHGDKTAPPAAPAGPCLTGRLPMRTETESCSSCSKFPAWSLAPIEIGCRNPADCDQAGKSHLKLRSAQASGRIRAGPVPLTDFSLWSRGQTTVK